MIKIDPADLFVGENIFLQIRFGDILQFIAPEFSMLVVQDLLVLIPFSHVGNAPENKKGRLRFHAPSQINYDNAF